MAWSADPFAAMADSPVGLLLCAAIAIGSLATHLALRRQWARPGYPRAARNMERVALVVTTLAALLLVVYGSAALQERDSRARMQAELEQRSAQALALRARIAVDIGTARALLADRAVDKIAQEKLVEARAELARFIPFKDPGIMQMITLIDRELEIRESLRQRLPQGDPK